MRLRLFLCLRDNDFFPLFPVNRKEEGGGGGEQKRGWFRQGHCWNISLKHSLVKMRGALSGMRHILMVFMVFRKNRPKNASRAICCDA